jgi:hypothetical protein
VADPLAVHSGATVRDFHPLPFSPAVTGEHLGTTPYANHMEWGRQIDVLRYSGSTAQRSGCGPKRSRASASGAALIRGNDVTFNRQILLDE